MRIAPILTLAALFAFLTSAARAATPAEVDKAIDRAKAFLYSRQKTDGTWEQVVKKDADADPGNRAGGQWGGETSLMLYALLAAGESPRDAKLVKTVEFVKKAEIDGTYALAMRMLACSFLPETPDVKALLRKDHDALLRSVRTAGAAKGMYDYIPARPGAATRVSRPPRPGQPEPLTAGGPYSHSRSQYGVLGVWIATQEGIETPSLYWKTVEEGWIRNQDVSGGWAYLHPDQYNYPVTPGMTAAGIASLYITQDFTTNFLEPKGNPKNPAIDKAMEWLGKNMDKFAVSDQYDRAFTFATMYAFERIGVASGWKYIGTTDWFAKGADYLVKNQIADGSWDAAKKFGGVQSDAAFATVFLARGRAPVIMQKLQYDLDEKGTPKEANWNQRPRDVANITRFFSRQIERDVNWQITNLKAPLEDLFDAPILYLSGNQPLAFTPEQLAKLKAYAESGGLILGHSDNANNLFTQSFLKLGAALFSGREFRELPPAHPIFANLDKNTPPQRLLGLSNGARELMILIPSGDPARAWQAQSFRADRAPAALTAQSIFLYACEVKNLRVKGTDVLFKQDPAVAAKVALKIARLEYGGNWDPEPAAVGRLARHLHNTTKITLTAEPVKVGTGKLAGYKLAHLTGTATFRLDPDAKTELQKFIDSGGALLVESCGGSAEFAKSATEILAELFPKSPPVLLPAGEGLLTNLKPADVQYRTFSRRTNQFTPAAGSIKVLSVNNRPAIIVSEADLSCGWLGVTTDGIHGYTPDTALKLAAEILTPLAK